MGDGPNKGKLTWRDGLKAMGVGGFSLFFGGLADLMFFRGFVTSHLMRAKNDSDYRDRLINTIKQGRLDDKLKMEVEERIRPYNEICALGDPLNYHEELLDDGFENYEVRQFITGGEETNNLLLIANYGSNVRTYKTNIESDRFSRLTETMKQSGNFLTIPSSYVTTRELNGKYSYVLDSYCTYIHEGKIETYSEDKIDYAYGAIVLFDNGKMRVIDKSEMMNYQVGQNCIAVQSYGIALNSETLDTDMRSLEETGYNTGGNAARSRDQTAFMLTLSDKETDREESLIISLYQHLDSRTGQVAGNEWQLGLSMEQMVGICEQLALERQYDKFVLVGPDPNHFHSHMNGPAEPIALDDSNKNLLRRFDYWKDPIFAEEEVGQFAPPFFFGVALKS